VLAQLTPFELLTALLVIGLVSALCGWAGGAGALFRFSARVQAVESIGLQLVNRAKGQAGQVQTQATRNRKLNADEEAEILRQQLLARGRPGVPGAQDWRALSPEQQEVYFDDLAEKRGLKFKVK